MRILLVDNFEPFRRLVCSILLDNPHLGVVAEAADGVEAVHKAGELTPDLILMDVDLPDLGGIEVARHIRQLSTRSKIVFVTQQTSLGILREALAAGGRGYVIKSRAVDELLPAIEAVLQGDWFVSRALANGRADA